MIDILLKILLRLIIQFLKIKISGDVKPVKIDKKIIQSQTIPLDISV